MVAFVLGNGISRKSVAIESLKQVGSVYGCNAVYRTDTLTVLVSADAQIAKEIQESGYSKNNRFYTRRPFPHSGAREIPKPYFGYSSGPIAAGIACDDGNRKIYLLGFDLGPNTDGQFNNIYAGTTYYKPVGALPTYTGNWIKQLSTVMLTHSNVDFVRVVGETTQQINEFDTITNLSHVPLDTFVNRINMQKDL